MRKISSARRNECEGRVKYTSLTTSEDSISSELVSLSETSPLLENFEALMISTPVGTKHVKSTPVKTKHVNSTPVKPEHANSAPVKTERVNSMSVKTEPDTENRNDTEMRPEAETDHCIDIVRKRNQSMSKTIVHWRVIGPYHTIKLKKCQRLYADTGSTDDLALFFHNGKFYVMNAWCSHMGKTCL